MLTEKQARVSSAENILTHLHQEFPTWNAQLLHQSGDLSVPRYRHPVFYGSYDWHSSVHSHWALVKALPALDDWDRHDEALTSLSLSLSSPEVVGEVETWLKGATMQTPYGATWFLRLCAELRWSPIPSAPKWLANLETLEFVVAETARTWLSNLRIADRSGQHGNSAWSLQQMAIYARSIGDENLLEIVTRSASDLFLNDKEAPFAYEPSAASFFSPLLNEAALMANVLPTDQFNDWLMGFAPTWFGRAPQSQLAAAPIADTSDFIEAHLVALPLTKSIALSRIAVAVSDATAEASLQAWAREFLETGLAAAASPDYAVSHWISSYVIEALAAND